MVNTKLFQQFIFWGVWLIIPLIWEIFVGILSSIIVALKHIRRKNKNLDYFPRVTILIPVYNSQNTLKMCLESVFNQDYPKDKLEVFLIDNGSKDNSYSIFEQFQAHYTELRLWWYFSHPGKSKALNKGIFGCTGKYIINIDSDGFLDKFAIQNIIKRFEGNNDITCMTGVVLIDPNLIEETKGVLLKLLRVCELLEYIQSFLVGRNYHSTFNSMYTLAGAFSCFRREALVKTQMYNSETLGEDTHMTFQIRNFVGGNISLCEDAFFYVDPIENINKLYTQRQRWQRGEIEVASLFDELHTGGIKDYFKKFTVRLMVSDHTLAFPRLIWFFAMIYLYFINYPLKLLIGTNVLMYISYVVNDFIYLLVSRGYLKGQISMRNYIFKYWYINFILPFYRFIVYWMRMAGIINSLTTESKWRVYTFSDEVQILKENIKKYINSNLWILKLLRKVFNN